MAAVTNTPQNSDYLRIGAGGWLTGFDQHADGTLVARTDTFGAYLWVGDDQDYDDVDSHWVQLVNETSMPSGDLLHYNTGGTFDICIAPTDSNTFYMIWLGWLYKSTNRGTTWTKTAMPRMTNTGGGYGVNQGAQRLYGPKIAIDPLTANVVYVGTQDDGLLRTLDGGATWTTRTDVPVGTGSAGGEEPGVTGILFDPLSGATSGRTANVWASSYGNGYYRSTDGGTTWSKPTGGSATCARRAAFSTDGKLYMAEDGGEGFKVWKWNGSAWSDISPSMATTPGVHSIACDPFDANRIIVGAGSGATQETLNGGTSWGSVVSGSNVRREASHDIPWLENANEFSMSNGDIRFHPTTQNRLMFSEGIGFWYADVLPSATVNNWRAMSRGVEQLVANQVMHTPPTAANPRGNLCVAAWDRQFFKSHGPRIYPDHYQKPVEPLGGVRHSFGIDYCSSNPDIVGMVSSFDSGISSDGGNTFTNFAGLPAWLDGGQFSGEIAISTPLNYIWVPGFRYQPHYTLNGGTTWTGISISGIDNDSDTDDLGWGGYNWSYLLCRHICAADRVTANKFYLYHYKAGLYQTVDGGANWTQRFAGPLLPSITGFHAKLRCPEGKAGHLWFTAGDVGGTVGEAAGGAFIRSTNGGTSWSTIADVVEVLDFGFGKIAPGASYPTIWIIGWVNGTNQAAYGIYYSTDEAVSWTKVATYPNGNIDTARAIDGSKTRFNSCYIGYGGSGWSYLDGALEGKKSWRLGA